MNVARNPAIPLFHHRYRVPSSRLSTWDYTGNGSYFITICTDERYPWFGHIRNRIMCVSDIGAIIDDEWQRTGYMRSCVTLDRYIVMPDHFHGIIMIDHRDMKGETPQRGVSTAHNTAHDPTCRDQWKPQSLGAIINQFKSACTKRIWKTGHADFAWQPRFHDSIIRDDRALRHIRQYILDNPAKWPT